MAETLWNYVICSDITSVLFTMILFCLVLFSADRVSSSPGWPWAHIAQAGLEPLIFLPPQFQEWQLCATKTNLEYSVFKPHVSSSNILRSLSYYRVLSRETTRIGPELPGQVLDDAACSVRYLYERHPSQTVLPNSQGTDPESKIIQELFIV